MRQVHGGVDAGRDPGRVHHVHRADIHEAVTAGAACRQALPRLQQDHRRPGQGHHTQHARYVIVILFSLNLLFILMCAHTCTKEVNNYRVT